MNENVFFKSNKKKIELFPFLLSFCFVLLPIFDIYNFPGTDLLSIGEAVLVICMFFSAVFLIKRREKIDFNFYFVFLIVSATMTILSIFTHSGFSIKTNAIRVVRDFIYAIFFVWISSKLLNINQVYNIYKIIVICLCCLFIIQYFIFYIYGYHITFFVPFLKLNYIISSPQVLAYERFHYKRFESVFLEPASFACYIAPSLVLSLFKKEKKDYIFAFFVSAILVLIKSAGGYMLLVVTWIMKFVLSKNIKLGIKIIVFPMLLIVFLVYITMTKDNPNGIYQRVIMEIFTDNTYSSGKLRVVRGFLIYNEFPFSEKLFGVGVGNLSTFILANNIHIMDTNYIDYMNSIAYVLCTSGIFGLGTYLIAFVKLCVDKKNCFIIAFSFVTFTLLIANSIYLSLLYLFYMSFIFMKGTSDFCE